MQWCLRCFFQPHDMNTLWTRTGRIGRCQCNHRDHYAPAVQWAHLLHKDGRRWDRFVRQEHWPNGNRRVHGYGYHSRRAADKRGLYVWRVRIMGLTGDPRLCSNIESRFLIIKFFVGILFSHTHTHTHRDIYISIQIYTDQVFGLPLHLWGSVRHPRQLRWIHF